MTGVPAWDVALVTIFGLLIGSFLNVVIHRVPKMMERQWDAECKHYAQEAGWLASGAQQEDGAAARFNLMTPRSRCPSCGHEVRWYENIPIVSYIGLRGRCSGCGTSIGLRYPFVELLTGLLFYLCVSRFGWSYATLVWCGFSAALIALAFIDWDTTLLPDDITLPLLWAGLVVSYIGWIGVSLQDAVVGAVAGYLSLWCVFWGFKILTGKEGMGYGDFKLLAALGAWLGWQALVPVILLASVIGAVVGIVMKLSNGLREGKYIPFGPFLAGGGLVVMLFGQEVIMRSILGVLGL